MIGEGGEDLVKCEICRRPGSMDLLLGNCFYMDEPHCKECCDKQDRKAHVPHNWKPFPESF